MFSRQKLLSNNRQAHQVLVGLVMVLLASLVLAGCAPAQSTVSAQATAAPGKAQSQLVSADEALKILKDNSQATLLDVRTPAEFAEGHIAGAVNIAVEELADRASELPADKTAPIIVYCRSGRRSAIAAATLIELGYSAVSDLGGIQDWPYEIVK